MAVQIRLAYYCSGHGYGHATRVSAFASALMSLEEKPDIYVVSSAPTHVFSECIGRGAHYRHAEVDPVISQPLAYKVDRQKSVQVLRHFLSEKEDKLAVEVAWLSSTQIDCVLSDSAFLAWYAVSCLLEEVLGDTIVLGSEAATLARIPSILITNFTFDSVYSYLGSEISDCGLGLPSDTFQIPHQTDLTLDDTPVPLHILEPLVSQLLAGYRHADMLLLLPGFIPIPSFFPSPSLPATAWIHPSTNRFRPEIESTLLALSTSELSPSIPFPDCILPQDGDALNCPYGRKPPRAVKYAPLLVRPASSSINTCEGRQKLLTSIGIPDVHHDPNYTRILLVSFGGQTIKRPNSGKSPSSRPHFLEEDHCVADEPTYNPDLNIFRVLEGVRDSAEDIRRPTATFSRKGSTKIFIPGAPAPANNPASPHSPTSPQITSAMGIQLESTRPLVLNGPISGEEDSSLLPSPSWIAIICGVPSNWSLSGEGDEDLPPGFYVAPRDVYMPDLTAIADVLLGKLGYGTVSECVAQSTPLVYGASLWSRVELASMPCDIPTVPRPLFVEEHGLRLLLEAEGTGVEMSRHEYESGQWAKKVEEAYLKGKTVRPAMDRNENEQEVKNLASWVVESVRSWQGQET